MTNGEARGRFGQMKQEIDEGRQITERLKEFARAIEFEAELQRLFATAKKIDDAPKRSDVELLGPPEYQRRFGDLLNIVREGRTQQFFIDELAKLEKQYLETTDEKQKEAIAEDVIVYIRRYNIILIQSFRIPNFRFY